MTVNTGKRKRRILSRCWRNDWRTPKQPCKSLCGVTITLPLNTPSQFTQPLIPFSRVITITHPLNSHISLIHTLSLNTHTLIPPLSHTLSPPPPPHTPHSSHPPITHPSHPPYHLPSHTHLTPTTPLPPPRSVGSEDDAAEKDSLWSQLQSSQQEQERYPPHALSPYLTPPPSRPLALSYTPLPHAPSYNYTPLTPSLTLIPLHILYTLSPIHYPFHPPTH